MGFIINIIKQLFKFIVLLLGFVAFIVLIPNIPPYTKFSSIELEPLLPKEGPLAINDALNKAGKLYDEKLLGPEAFAIYNGEIYTGLATGEVVKLSPGGHVTFVTKIGQPCTGIREPHKCGRPLGLVIDEQTKHLYVADAYYGIWKVNLNSDKKQLLVSPYTKINRREPKIFNSIALSKNGDFYWTDSSSDFDLINGVYSTLADPSGRLLYYNAAHNESKVLLDNLWFPNGVVVSPDQQFVLVSETSRFRVMKYYIDGPKKGKSEAFVTGLPGTPDNMRALPDGSGVLVALYTAFDENNPLLIRSLSQTPIIRKFLARLSRLIEIPCEFLNQHFPHFLFEDIIFYTGHFHSMSGLLPDLTGLIQMDWNGKIIASYYNTDKSLNSISDAIVYNGKLLTGNPNMQNYVGAVPAPPLLIKAFASKQSSIPPKTAQTVTIEMPKQKPEQPKKVEKAQAKPTEAPKPSATPVKTTQAPPTQKPEVKTTTSKPTTTTKPTSKPTTAAPTATPKPTQAPTTEAPKTTPPPKPAVTTPAPNKPHQKPAPTNDAKSAKQTENTQKSSKQTTTPMPKTTPPAKKAESESETTTAKSETKPKVAKTREDAKTPESKPEAGKKAEPKSIPITEEIPSDTAKPKREKLKVITKNGPTEIPNPLPEL